MNELTFDELVANGWVIAGSPETVASRLKEMCDEAGAARVVIGANTGSKPRWLTMKSLTMFAEEVIPRLRPGGKPQWAQKEPVGYGTASEYGARKPRGGLVPTATFGSGLVDVTRAHLDQERPIIETWPPE